MRTLSNANLSLLGLFVSAWCATGCGGGDGPRPPLLSYSAYDCAVTQETCLTPGPSGPDGRPMSYRLDSKALGRELKEDETLAAAGIPEGDRLMMTADVTAG